MPDQDPIAQDYCAIPQASAIVRDARADERRKVIAELRPWLRHDPQCAKQYAPPGTGACTCLLDAFLALAPEEEGGELDVMVCVECGRETRAYRVSVRDEVVCESCSLPSPARAGDVEREPTLEALRDRVAAARVDVMRTVRRFNARSWTVVELARTGAWAVGDATVTALAVYDLVESGALDLDEHLRVSLPPTSEERSAAELTEPQFAGWPLDSVRGAYRICQYLDTSPAITGRAREVLHGVVAELADEIITRRAPTDGRSA